MFLLQNILGRKMSMKVVLFHLDNFPFLLMAGFCDSIANVGTDKASSRHCLDVTVFPTFPVNMHFDFNPFRGLITYCTVCSVGQTDRQTAAEISTVDFKTFEVTFK